jgi:hypothetical protein
MQEYFLPKEEKYMYSIKDTAAGRRIGLIGSPAALPSTGRAGLILCTPGGKVFIKDPALMYGFSVRRRERRFK